MSENALPPPRLVPSSAQPGELRQLQERITLALDFSSHQKIHDLGILITTTSA